MGGVFNRFSLVFAILVAFIGINATSKAFAAADSITVHKGDMNDVPAQTLNFIKELGLQDAIITSDNGCFYTKETKQSADYINQDVYQILAHHDMNLGNLSLVWKNAAIDSNNETCDVKLSFSNFNYPDGRPDEDSPIITAYTDKTICFGPNPGTDSTKNYKFHSLTADAELKFTRTQSGTEASGIYLFSFRGLDQIDKSKTQTVESVTLVDGYIGDSYIPTNSTLDITNNNKTYSSTTCTDETTDYTAGFVAPVKATSHFHIEEPGWAYVRLFDNFSKQLFLGVWGSGKIIDNSNQILLENHNTDDSKMATVLSGWKTSKTLHFIPDKGFKIDHILIDSKTINNLNIYTFENITEDHKAGVSFSPIRYLMKYNGNGATSGTTKFKYRHYGETFNLTKNEFKKTGYKFTGWKRKDTGELYSDEQSVSNLTDVDDATIEMDAQWEPDSSSLIPIELVVSGGPATVESDSGLIVNRTHSDYQDGELAGSYSTREQDHASANTTRTYKITAPDGFYVAYIGWGLTGDSDQFSDLLYPPRGSITYTYTTPQINLLQNQSTKILNIKIAPMYYVMLYDANGGTGYMSAISINYEQSKALSVNTFTYSNKKFVNWNTEPDGSGISYSDGQVVRNLVTGNENNGKGITLYAQWKSTIHTVTFIDGHTHEEISSISVNDGDSVTPPDIPLHTGYTSTGWDSDLSTVTSDMTVTVNYRANNYTIQFDKNNINATGTMPNLPMEYDKSKNLSANAFSYPGYRFLNWNTESDGNGQLYSDEQSVKNLTATNGGTVTLYAQWLPNSHTVTFVDGLTHETITQRQVNHGESVTPPAYPAHTGYTPTGWDKTASNITADTTITVNYRANNYTIKFDKNSNRATGTMPDIQMEYGQSKTLSRNAFALAGSSWLNWNTEANGSGRTYTDRQQVSNLVDTDGGEITLYAQWSTNAYTVTFVDGYNGKTIKQESVDYGNSATAPSAPNHTGYTSTGWDKPFTNVTENITVTLTYAPNSYTISFDGNGSTSGTMQPLGMKYGTAKNLTANEYSRTGYTWSGWSTNSDGTGTSYTDGQRVENLTDTNNGSVTLYAKWIPNAYKIQFDKNRADASGTTASMSMEYGTAKNLTANGFSSPSAKFIGWNTKPNGTGTSYSNGQSVKNLTSAPNDIVTLYAKWATNTYTVTFVDGLDGKTLKSEEVGYRTSATAPDAPIHKGYTDNGWDKEFDNITSDITITRRYTANRYTIAFDGNESTDGSMEPMSMTYGTSKNLTHNAYTRTGYTWSGWNTSSNGSGTAYRDEQEVKNLSSDNGSTVTLYAQWTPISYTIKFDKNRNDATGTTSSMSMQYGTAKNLTANGFSSPSSKFAGWNNKSNGSGKSYSNSQSVKNLSDVDGSTITLYAQWSTNAYTVTFVDGTDGSTLKQEEVEYGHSATAPEAPSHVGYTDNGWDKKFDNITESTTVTRRYTANAYKIAFDGNGSTGGEMQPMSMTYGSSKALTAKAYTRTGYQWSSWSMKKDGSGKSYQDRQEVKNLTSDNGATVTLYSQWAPNTYTIKFDKNRDDASGTTEQMNMSYGASKSLTPNGFSSASAKFAGWNTKKDGNGTAYSNRQSVKNLTDDNGGTVTLYAQWSTNTYAVAFIDGHTSKTIATVNVPYGSSATAPDKPTHTGYTETGWDKSFSNITKDTSVTLAYRPNRYTVTFSGNADGVTGSTSNMSMEYGKEASLTANGYSRDGYSFAGWTSASNGSGTSYSDRQKVSNLTDRDGDTITLYAKWKANRYTVTFIDGKTGETIGTQEVEYGGNATFPSVPSHTGYTPGEWSGNGKNITGDTSITMSYAPISYTVAFDKNCDTASGKTPSQSMRYDQKSNLTANGFSRNGYTFSGWNTKQNASGQQYSDRQSVMNLTDRNGSTVTLYAQWVENGHVSILYKAETDDNAKGNGNSISNAMDDLNPVTGTAKGSTAEAGKAYDFVGWYDEEGKKVSDSAKFTPDKPTSGAWENASYTAKFIRKTFNVRFLGKDGNVIKEDSVKYGNDATAPEAPSIDGYEFSKWDKEFTNITTNLDVTAIYMESKKDDENASKDNENETQNSNGNVPSTTENLIQTGIEVGVPAIGAISLAAIADAYRRKRRR